MNDTTDLDFGNVCLGPGGGRTIGFWRNKNGKAILNSNEGAWQALLSGLNLVDQSGSDFDPANTTELMMFLKRGKATNMSYMLSVQLAAMALNTAFGDVDGTSTIFAGEAPDGCSPIIGLSGLGFISVNDLIADASTELGLDGNTPPGDPERTCQEFKKDALDDANNNLSFVQAEPCEVNNSQ